MRKNGKYIKCKNCGKEFYISKSRFSFKKYCSNKCSHADKMGFKPIKKKCFICGKEFLIDHQLKLRKKTCSKRCWQKNSTFLYNKRRFINKKCIKCGSSYRGLRFRPGLGLCSVCRYLRLSEMRKGKGNPAYKGGVSHPNELVRKSREYKKWRTSVFERDDYTCQKCGIRSGNGKAVVLHADHIKPFAHHSKLRFEISNGRTLCIECHRKTKTFGFKSVLK